MPKTRKKTARIVVTALMLAVMAAAAYRSSVAEEPAAVTAPVFKTTGEVVDGPLEIGCWAPLNIETPKWIFPMVYQIYTRPEEKKQLTPEEYAMRFVEVIKTFPPDRPVWLQSHRWMGDYKPGWDTRNVMAHIDDATEEKTPGIWPEKGIKYWIGNQERFLKTLKENGCRLDMWPLDHETSVHEWAHNWSSKDVFKNIVFDPRWKEKPIPGLGIVGARLLDPAELANEKSPWIRKFFDNVEDSRLACHAVTVAATFMPTTVLNEAFYRPIAKEYPHAVVSDYGQTKYVRPLTALVKDIDDQTRELNLDEREAGMRPFWKKIREIKPELTEIPGVGNAAAPSFYGQKHWADLHSGAGGIVEGILAEADVIIERYGGDPTKLTPWITLPSFASRWPGKRLSPEEYERMLVGLAERGVRQYILWFDPKSMNTKENCEEFLKAANKAYEAAKKYRAARSK